MQQRRVLKRWCFLTQIRPAPPSLRGDAGQRGLLGTETVSIRENNLSSSDQSSLHFSIVCTHSYTETCVVSTPTRYLQRWRWHLVTQVSPNSTAVTIVEVQFRAFILHLFSFNFIFFNHISRITTKKKNYVSSIGPLDFYNGYLRGTVNCSLRKPKEKLMLMLKREKKS